MGCSTACAAASAPRTSEQLISALVVRIKYTVMATQLGVTAAFGAQ